MLVRAKLHTPADYEPFSIYKKVNAALAQKIIRIQRNRVVWFSDSQIELLMAEGLSWCFDFL